MIANVKGFVTPDGKRWEVDAQRANWSYPSHRALRWFIYEKFDYRCVWCGEQAVFEKGWIGEKALLSKKGQILELDHILPVAKGGRFSCDNLQLLCHACNVKKGAQA
jgi:5-methylcytosine-specific restriction endonuclease McrA